MLLAQAPARLQNLTVSLFRFSAEVCDALLIHADSLENLNITFHGDVESGLQSMNRVLTSCCNLRSLAIYYAADKMDHDFPSRLCTSEPWKCTKLNTLYLDGFAMAQTTDGEDPREYEDREEELLDDLSSHGWSVTIIPGTKSSDRLIVSYRRYEIFERVWDMENLFKVHVDGLEYLRNDRMRGV